MTESAYRAARRLIEPHLEAILDHRRRHPPAPPPATRNSPREADMWRRYCHAVITSMQPISETFWDRIMADATWVAIAGGEYSNRPQLSVVQECLERCGVRFAQRKAAWIHAAWEHDVFGRLADAERSILRGYHDADAEPFELRAAELELARVLVTILSGFGVGPKIARLMMIWAGRPEALGTGMEYVIPIDSRWLRELASVGVKVAASDLGDEDRYRTIENDLCRAAMHLGASPALADGAIWGWLGTHGPTVEEEQSGEV